MLDDGALAQGACPPDRQDRRDCAVRAEGAALAGGPGPRAWSVLELRGREAVDDLFDYQVLLRREPGGDAPRPQELLGLDLQLRIELATPGAAAPQAPRWIHGVVSQAACLHEDARGRVYALRLRPWAWRARLRGRCRSWRGRSVPQVLRELVQPSGARMVERLQRSYAPLDYIVQFNQSDWECFARLCRRWGIVFWFEHRRGGHELVLADEVSAMGELPAPQWRSLGVGRPGDRADHECLQRLRCGHALHSCGWRRGDAAPVGPGGPRAHGAGAVRALAAGCRLGLRDHRLAACNAEWLVLEAHLHLREGPDTPWPWAATWDDAAQREPDWAGRARSGAGPSCDLDDWGDSSDSGGAGDWRESGDWGESRDWGDSSDWGDCGDGPQRAARGPGAACAYSAWRAPADGFGDAGRAWEFGPVGARHVGGWQLRAEVLLRPATAHSWAAPRRPEPARVHGVQATLVAGGEQPRALAGEVHTDAFGRVRASFPWDRVAATAPGDSAAATAPLPTTPWLRTAMPWAGCAMGRQQLPRVGQELLAGFVDGDVEQPVGLGTLHYAQHLPPWTLPRNRALTGLRSRELPQARPDPAASPDGAGDAGAQPAPRGNQLLLDDTPRALQLQLDSEHLRSALALGRVTRVLAGQGREQPRGSGAELRTDGHGLLHAADGMLLSSHPRALGRGMAADALESRRELRRAGARHAAAGRAAAQARLRQARLQQALGERLRTAADGAAASSDDGGSAVAAAPHGGGGGANAGQAADTAGVQQRGVARDELLLGGADGFTLGSDASTQLHAGARLGLSAGAQLGVCAGTDLLAGGAGGLRMIAHRLGMRLLAAAGPLHLHACAGALQAGARDGLLLQSDGDMHLRARKGIVLYGGGSFLRLSEDGIHYGGPGAFELHSAGCRLLDG